MSGVRIFSRTSISLVVREQKASFEGVFLCNREFKEFPITQKCTNDANDVPRAKMQVVASDALSARMCQGSNCSQVEIF